MVAKFEQTDDSVVVIIGTGAGGGTFHISGGIVEVLRNQVVVLAESASA